MNAKDSLLLVVGSLIGMVGTLLGISNKSGADYLKGFGAGLMVVFCINVIPKIIKKKNETVAK
jgi:zinc transporter ZupT